MAIALAFGLLAISEPGFSATTSIPPPSSGPYTINAGDTLNINNSAAVSGLTLTATGGTSPHTVINVLNGANVSSSTLNGSTGSIDLNINTGGTFTGNAINATNTTLALTNSGTFTANPMSGNTNSTLNIQSSYTSDASTTISFFPTINLNSGTFQVGGSITGYNQFLITAGTTLQTNIANVLTPSATGFLNLAGTLSPSGHNQNVGDLSGSGTITFSANETLTFGTNTGGKTFSGVVQGGSGVNLTKANSGTQTLTGTNTYTGITNVTGGTLLVQSANVIPANSNVVVSAGASFGFSGTGFTYAGPAISGSGGVVVQTGNTAPLMTLSGTNTYIGGTTISANGALVLGNSNAAGTGALILQSGATAAAGATLLTSANLIGANALSNAFSLTGTGIATLGGTVSGVNSSSFTLSGNGSLNGNNLMMTPLAGTTITLNTLGDTGGGILTVNGAGTAILLGAGTYTGGTTISSGTLLVGSASSLGSGLITLSGGTLGANSDLSQQISNTFRLTAASTLGGGAVPLR